ncbi:DUF1697 domain-containing protein [Pseudorhodoferax sp.]|uniref:DUF1697 domain-containing protein n=1 Tax=Pseudorhodoferax sp. TaxID=1993553 RepID=UPI0039E42E52
MPRYVALLRGVSPQNCSMPALRRSLEAAGFARVRTVLSSGNAVFDADEAPEAVLAQRVEAAQQAGLGRRFATIVRSVDALQALLAGDPFAPFGFPPQAKRVVSFLRAPRASRVPLPLTRGCATVACQVGAEAFTAYLPGEGPVFMQLIEQAFGVDVTTRTWDTVRKCAQA